MSNIINKTLIIPAILFIFFTTFSYSNYNHVILDKMDSYEVKIKILKDTKNILKFSDILNSKKFKTAIDKNFGFTSTVVWAKFTYIIPEYISKEWFLEIGYPLLDVIDVFIPNGNDYKVKKYGDHLPFDSRDINHHNFLVKLINNPGTYTYYIRVQTESNLSLPLKFVSSNEIISKLNSEKTIFGLFYGILLIMAIYNLLLSISMKDITYLCYVGLIISMILISLSLNGYGFQYIWPNTLWLNNITPFLIFLTIFTMVTFTYYFLNISSNYPKLKYFMHAYGVIIIIGLVTSLIIPYKLSIKFAAASYLPGISFTFVPLIDSFRKIYREARYYFLALSFLFIGVIITVLHRFGLFPNNYITMWGFQIGAVFSVALLSLGLADKVNFLKDNLEELNLNLEKKVADRTIELSNANNEIEAAMEELTAVNENLINVNSQLEDSQGRYSKDVYIATSVQKALLPKKAPESNLYDIAFTFKPNAGVSGDFYDFYKNEDNLKGVGLFDVSGHGISAGLLTLMARSIVNRNFNEYKNEDISTVIENTNKELIEEISQVDNYITGILLRFRGEKIDYVNCGHPDIIFKLAKTNKTGTIVDKTGNTIKGSFLGIDAMNESFNSLSLKLNSGDCILLYTDCLIETANQNGEPFDETGILKSLKSTNNSSAKDILEHIIHDFYKHIGNKDLISDDLTAILIKRK